MVGPRPVAIRKFQRELLSWFDSHARDLPWRRTADPYHIWISEIMLQQTRVTAVLDYYSRFLALFPTITALALAKEPAVLAAWSGLGYYRRAKMMHRAAQVVVEQHQGALPTTAAELRKLPGIGEYTSSAIASIAFGERVAVVDGNVERVLLRVFPGDEEPATPAAQARWLRERAASLVDPSRPGDFNQSMMELGATVCLPKQPQCLVCPLARDCRARESGRQNELPLKSARPGAIDIQKQLLVIEKAGKILAWKRPADSRRLAGFWELPEPAQLPRARIETQIARFRHTIVNTNFSFDVFRASLERAPAVFQWLAKDQLREFPLSTTAKKALASVDLG